MTAWHAARLTEAHRRQLPRAHKKSYIEAVLCLTTKPAISGITGAVHRYDDFVAVHNSQTPAIHWVGHFILWHRYFVATYEEVLRTECGYTGGNPYGYPYTINYLHTYSLPDTGTGLSTPILRILTLPVRSKQKFSPRSLDSVAMVSK